MRRVLIIAGLLVVLAGVAWPWISRLPFGRLPGDMVIERPGMRVYLPLATSLLVSAALSLILWLFRHR